MDRKQITKLEVIGLLRAAETDPAASSQAWEALARFILAVAYKEAGEGRDRSFVEEGANRVFIKLGDYIKARGMTDPEHIVNLAKFFIRGGYLPGKKERIPGIFAIMIGEQEDFWSRHDSLSEPPSHGPDPDGKQMTVEVEEVTPNPTVIAPVTIASAKQEIICWVEELARAAEANKDRVKRETLNALILYIKHRVAHCNGISSSVDLYELKAVPIETLLKDAELKDADLSEFNAGLFDKTESQWMIRKDACKFLREVMGRNIQNTVRQRVNRVLPILCGIRLRCESDVLGVEGICRDRNIHPDTENANEGEEEQ
jgi:hypothetical protein